MPTRAASTSVSIQRTFIDSPPERPSPKSTLLINRFSTTNDDGTENHTVVGVHIVLAKGDANNIWDTFNVDRATQRIDGNNPKVATKSITICCDTLEVHGEFSVPEANIDVFARRLVWADDAARINTSPLEWTTAKAADAVAAAPTKPGQTGAEGRNAGKLRVFVRQGEPETGSRTRLIANGGRGQDPGAGHHGKPGAWMVSYDSYPFQIDDSGISTSKRTVNFSPTAVFIGYDWWWTRIRTWGPGTLGEDRFPTNGGDALVPGMPGNGGNGGELTTSSDALRGSFRNDAGAAGKKESDYRGGDAGTPTHCAKYKVALYEDLLGTDNASYESNKTAENQTKRGADAQAKPATKGAGTSPPAKLLDVSNAWLHPLSLEVALEYIRDLFLAGVRDEVRTLIEAYDDALALPPPENDAWSKVPPSQWTGAQIEAATMRHRLNVQLDYFGNPAGFTPLLSLSGAIRLYEGETSRALHMMLLTRWAADVDRDATAAAAAMADAIATLNDDSHKAAAQVVDSEAKIQEVERLITSVEQDLTALQNRLVDVKNNLLVKAVNDLERQAAIKAGIKMAGALCQVIPVGQPALGTIGSLADVAADFVGGDPDAAPDTLSKMSKVLEKAVEAAGKTKEASGKVKTEKDAADAKEAKDSKDKSSTWATIGKGLGPAVSGIAEAVRALQVPQSEIEAELAKLESQDPEWNAITRDIRDVNEKKTKLFDDLADALEAAGDGFARLASNASDIVTLQQQREKRTGKVDPEAISALRQLGQRSRLRLQHYLYLMVKAYESTLLRPLNVDWNLVAVTEKISELLKPESGLTAAGLSAQVKVLEPLFQQNLSVVRDQLLREFDTREQTITLRLGLSAQQTASILTTLNAKGQVVINPLRHGLILPDQQLARLSGVVMTQITFDPDGPTLSDDTNVIVKLVPSTVGTIRQSEGLFLLTSDAVVRWEWTYSATREIRPSTPSATAKDILNFILGPGAETIKQKIALPPAWSDLMLSIQFSPPVPRDRRPYVNAVYFDVMIDSSPAPELQRVLVIRAVGTPAGAITDCSPDLAQRGNGRGDIVRIYNKGETVRFSVPGHAGGSAFDGWALIGAEVDGSSLKEPSIDDLKMDDHVFALGHWSRSTGREGQPVVLARIADRETLAKIAERTPALRAGLVSLAATPRPEPHVRFIHIKPQAAAAVVGVVDTTGAPDVLGESAGDWRLVNSRGIVGWVED